MALFTKQIVGIVMLTIRRDIIGALIVQLNEKQEGISPEGCIFFILPPPREAKISNGCLRKKYDDFLRKNSNIRRKRWKNGGKGKFSLYIPGGKIKFFNREVNSLRS